MLRAQPETQGCPENTSAHLDLSVWKPIAVPDDSRCIYFNETVYLQHTATIVSPVPKRGTVNDQTAWSLQLVLEVEIIQPDAQ